MPIRPQFACAGSGGGRFFPGHIYAVLKCPIYVGKIPHKGESYEGIHQPIIDPGTWGAVQQRIAENRRERHAYAQARIRSPLAGLLFDAKGIRFTPTHAVKKNGMRYRYYVDQALTKGISPATADLPRIPALEIEKIVRQGLIAFFSDTPKLIDALGDQCTGVATERALRQAKNLCEELEAATPSTWMPLVRPVLQRIVVEDGAIRLHIAPGGLGAVLDRRDETRPAVMDQTGDRDERRTFQYVIPAQVRTRGGVMKLIVRNARNEFAGTPDPALVKAVARAHVWAEMLKSGKVNSVRNIADREFLTESYVTRVLRLAFLAPAVVEEILDGHSVRSLAEWLRMGEVISPIWAEQVSS